MDAAVSLLNIRETHRFSVHSWRLAALLPSGVRTSTSEQKTKIWHRVVGAMFQNYNSLLNQNHYVKCSDGQVRNIAMVLSMWQGDGPEIATACSLIQVCTVCVLLCTVIQVCTVCVLLCTDCVLFVYRETAICVAVPRISWMTSTHPLTQERSPQCYERSQKPFRDGMKDGSRIEHKNFRGGASLFQST
jgi:hypothetical protein